MDKKFVNMLNPETVITDKNKIEEIKESVKKKPAQKARRINKNALKLLKKMRRDSNMLEEEHESKKVNIRELYVNDVVFHSIVDLKYALSDKEKSKRKFIEDNLESLLYKTLKEKDKIIQNYQEQLKHREPIMHIGETIIKELKEDK